ncbi:hypothetical protein D9619_006335 [Psilocybe cf. subviscida]|uniref:Oxo-4-hydroxy-4-carboxy-5-ureidoimidazoline decarboxylase domain-containing protein n=1 Tax=Psilocybe cf. subviscida TaxID=2480587 RepID=A0A8H5B3S4_9AGAR|nr:hypothetical protein D9619_006335 [Psilocybe cf. subviscida]
MSNKLPTLVEIQSAPSSSTSPLAHTLDLLFEHSPVLVNVLEPQVSAALKSSTGPLASYAHLVEIALAELAKWNDEAQAQFIAGHPHIGESKNLSALSSKEQGAALPTPTPPEVLARLEYLNACYEKKYPGLRYITFVNGRSRAVIAAEMEGVLGLAPDDTPAPESISSEGTEFGSRWWKAELRRAVHDIGMIAKSRLGPLGAK